MTRPFITQDGTELARAHSASDIALILGLRNNRAMAPAEIASFIRTPSRDLSVKEVERVIVEHERRV